MKKKGANDVKFYKRQGHEIGREPKGGIIKQAPKTVKCKRPEIGQEPNILIRTVYKL